MSFRLFGRSNWTISLRQGKRLRWRWYIVDDAGKVRGSRPNGVPTKGRAQQDANRYLRGIGAPMLNVSEVVPYVPTEKTDEGTSISPDASEG